MLTLDPTVRSQLEDAVAALPTSKLKATRKAYFTTAFDKVLIFEQDDRWVLVASRGARPDLDVIAFKRAGDEVRDFTVPRLAEDGALKPLPTHLLPLARFVKWLGEEQARWIKDLKRGGASQESSEG